MRQGSYTDQKSDASGAVNTRCTEGAINGCAFSNANVLTLDERAELEQLRAERKLSSASARVRAFHQLDVALQGMNGRIDGTLTVRAFSVLAGALIALKDELCADP